MQRVQHISAGREHQLDRYRRLRHTVLYRLDGPWGLSAWYTLNDIVKGAEGAATLPGRPAGLVVATLANAGLVIEGPEVCLDGACMYKVKSYALSAVGRDALGESFVRQTGLWTAEDTKALKRATKRPKLT